MRPREGASAPGEGAFSPREGPLRPAEGAFSPREGPSRPGEGPFRPREGAFSPGEGASRPPEGAKRSAVLETVEERRSEGRRAVKEGPRPVREQARRLNPTGLNGDPGLIRRTRTLVEAGLIIPEWLHGEGRSPPRQYQRLGVAGSGRFPVEDPWERLTNRPNGPAEPSPGLRPKADALGKPADQGPRSLKGRENLGAR